MEDTNWRKIKEIKDKGMSEYASEIYSYNADVYMYTGSHRSRGMRISLWIMYNATLALPCLSPYSEIRGLIMVHTATLVGDSNFVSIAMGTHVLSTK